MRLYEDMNIQLRYRHHMRTIVGLIAVFLIVGITTTGCSSLVSKKYVKAGFANFLEQPRHYALFLPGALAYEDKLRVFGVEDYAQRLSRKFDIHDPTEEVVERFLASVPSLTETTVVQPKEAGDLPLDWNYPVFFFIGDWQFVYRRLPPGFSMNKLRMGIVAKIIPLGQVLTNRGTIALKTAVWEGKCGYEAFDGKFISLDEWEANNGELLYKGIEDLQNHCVKKLAEEYLEALPE